MVLGQQIASSGVLATRAMAWIPISCPKLDRTRRRQSTENCRTSRDALAVGFSKKDTGEKAGLYPQTELLCAIGLQRYRPQEYAYYAWEKRVPLSLTHAAAIQDFPGISQFRVAFDVHKVGQGAKEVVPLRKTRLSRD